MKHFETFFRYKGRAHEPNFFKLMKPRNTKWLEYAVWALLGLCSLSTKAATYYWVGGNGDWSELHHWAAVSNGTGNAFNRPPSVGDNVVFNRFSFTGSGQKVTVNSTSYCGSIDFTDAVYFYKLSTNAPTFEIKDNLSVTGDFISPASMKITNNGSIIFQGSGTKSINILSSISGSGSIQIHETSGTWLLINNLTAISNDLFLNKGTLNTNSKNITIRRFVANSGDNRSLLLGNSTIQLRCVSMNINGNVAPFWDASNSSNFHLIANNSNIEFYTLTNNVSVLMKGGNLVYNKITLNMPNSLTTSNSAVSNLIIEDNNTFNFLTVKKGNLLLRGNNTFISNVTLAGGARHRFQFGTTQYFEANTSFNSSATQSNPIYLQSTSNTNFATFSKPSGVVCTDQIYINGIRAIGGASWNSASNNFNQAPLLNSGWNFGASNAQISATIQGGTKCKNQPFNLKLTFSGTTYPVTVLLENMLSGKIDTIRDIVSSVYYHPVNPKVTTIYRLLQLSSSGCYTHVANFNTILDTVKVPLYGRLNHWVGRRSADWFDCYNWSDFSVPEDTVNITILPNIDSIQPVITGGAASTQRLEIAYDADLTLVGSNTVLNVYGDFVNHGRFNPNDARVSFIGNDVNLISGGTYSNLTINNTTPQGIAIQDTVVISGTLTLNNGILKTNGNLVSVTNPSTQAITNFGSDNYINGPLERAIGDTGVYSFPVGDDVIYALCEVRPRGSTGGVSKLKVQFINKPGTDDGLNLQFGDVTINSVHPAGFWLIEPDQQPNFGTGGISGDYELIFDVSGFSGLENYNFYILTRHDTSTNAADWQVAGIQSGATVQNGKITVSGITHFSQWGVGSGGGSLPVKMTEFKAMPVDNKYVQLKWTTETEINNHGFMVERSTDGKEFVSIGFVPGNGNTTETQHYIYNDKNVEKRQYYYRLKQIDFDESFEYSKIVSVDLNNDAQSIRIGEFIPNPASAIARVEVQSNNDNEAEFEFKNNAGQTVRKASIQLKKGSNDCTFDIHDMQAGSYIISITTEDKIFTRKLIIK